MNLHVDGAVAAEGRVALHILCYQPLTAYEPLSPLHLPAHELHTPARHEYTTSSKAYRQHHHGRGEVTCTTNTGYTGVPSPAPPPLLLLLTSSAASSSEVSSLTDTVLVSPFSVNFTSHTLVGQRASQPVRQ